MHAGVSNGGPGGGAGAGAPDETQRLDELTFLAEVARLAASARTWDELMGTIIDRARAASRAEVVSLYLMDRDGTGLTLGATNGLDQHAVGVARLRLGKGVTGLVARDRAPISIEDVKEDPRFAWIRGSFVRLLATAALRSQSKRGCAHSGNAVGSAGQ